MKSDEDYGIENNTKSERTMGWYPTELRQRSMTTRVVIIREKSTFDDKRSYEYNLNLVLNHVSCSCKNYSLSRYKLEVRG